MSKKIDLSEARLLLAQAVDTQDRNFVYARPNDKPYTSCVNVPLDDTITDTYLLDIRQNLPADSPKRITGCLVGTAMKLSGRVQNWNRYATGSVRNFAEFLTDEALHYFTGAQIAQDAGKTWGQAYDQAEAWANGVNWGRRGTNW